MPNHAPSPDGHAPRPERAGPQQPPGGPGEAPDTVADVLAEAEAVRDLFQQAGALSDDPVPWMYQAWAAMEAGDTAGCMKYMDEAHKAMGL